MSGLSFTLPAYAKINWTLRVLGRRADGYHDLETIFQTITLCDRLSFTSRADSLVSLTSDDPALPVDERNLVVRAARALKERFRVEEGAAVHLEKRIPAEAGLGGGSSDAAVALLGLAHLWRIETSAEELSGIGARLGADVPFFFTGGTALGLGSGTTVVPIAFQRDQKLAGAGGFEPTNAGSKDRCLTTWLRPNVNHAIGVTRRTRPTTPCNQRAPMSRRRRLANRSLFPTGREPPEELPCPQRYQRRSLRFQPTARPALPLPRAPCARV